MSRKCITKICEFCGNTFETLDNVHGRKKRFCNTSCSAKWRIQNYGVPVVSEEGRKHQSQSMKALWRNSEFREHNYKRMTENNPVHIPGIIEKANNTRLKNGGYHNNYKYGNGRISLYEQKVMPFLQEKGFFYNYAIPTKLARHAFPEEKFAMSYKPDFVHLRYKICIEIDGSTHDSEYIQKTDDKKDRCLNYLGFKVYRFKHKQIDDGSFFTEVEKLWQNL